MHWKLPFYSVGLLLLWGNQVNWQIMKLELCFEVCQGYIGLVLENLCLELEQCAMGFNFSLCQWQQGFLASASNNLRVNKVNQ